MPQILSYTITQMENYTCQCFNSVEVDEKRVDALIVAGADRSGPKGKAVHNKLQAIYSKMQAAEKSWRQ